MRIVVTGGAGFIGSHICDFLLAGSHDVLVVDNLSSGKMANLAGVGIAIKDITKDDLAPDFFGADAVFHYAADPEVRRSTSLPEETFRTNVRGTLSVLEACRKSDVKKIVFASTSTVYGEAKTLPTPESSPCEPISNYGASKLAGEAYCFSYAGTYGLKVTILRYANIFGPRSSHGVTYDFYRKLCENKKTLEILGDGRQKKSYLYISDAVEATIAAFECQQSKVEAYNIGSYKNVTVAELAKTVCAHLGATPKFEYTGGHRGWEGDVAEMLLDGKKISSLGWNEKTEFKEGIARYLDWLGSGKIR